MSLGPLEILLIVVVVALLFGAKKLPELARGIGQGLREFKQEVGGKSRELEAPVVEAPVTHLPATHSPTSPSRD